MRYYFDVRDGDTIARDETGLDCRSAFAARVEATKALVEMAADYLPAGDDHHDIAIHVRDGTAMVLTVRIRFDVAIPTATA